jgi:hypothetical protein
LRSSIPKLPPIDEVERFTSALPTAPILATPVEEELDK